MGQLPWAAPCMTVSFGAAPLIRLASLEPGRVQSLTLTNSGLLTTRAELDAMLQRWQVKSTAELLLPVDTAGVQRLMVRRGFRTS